MSFSLPVPCTPCSRPLRFPPLCAFSIAKNCAMLRCEIYFLFLPAPAPLNILSLTLSSPASRRLPAAITPRYPSLCPPPPATDI